MRLLLRSEKRLDLVVALQTQQLQLSAHLSLPDDELTDFGGIVRSGRLQRFQLAVIFGELLLKGRPGGAFALKNRRHLRLLSGGEFQVPGHALKRRTRFFAERPAAVPAPFFASAAFAALRTLMLTAVVLFTGIDLHAAGLILTRNVRTGRAPAGLRQSHGRSGNEENNGKKTFHKTFHRTDSFPVREAGGIPVGDETSSSEKLRSK